MTRKTTAYARKRRQAARSASIMDSISAGQKFISRLTADERQRVLRRLPGVRDRLLKAAYTFADFVDLSTAKHRCQAANDIHLVRDLQGLLQQAHAVLEQLGTDAEPVPRQWAPRALRAAELQTLHDLVTLYTTVVNEVTYAEWVRIDQLAVARVRSVRGEVYEGEAVHLKSLITPQERLAA